MNFRILPEETIKDLYKKISSYERIAFLSAIIIGLISHAFMLTNKLPNNDDIYCLVNSVGGTLPSGRWLLHIMGSIAARTVERFSCPWINGLITIVLIGLSSMLVVRLLEIKDSVLCFLIGAIMVSFPSIAGILFYMFTAPYYALSIFLAVLAVWCVSQGGSGKGEQHVNGFTMSSKIVGMWSWIWKMGGGGVLCLACSLGIYQAQWGFSASICLIILIKKCLEKENGKTLKLAIRYFAFLIMSLIMYLTILKLFLWLLHAQLTTYQSINQMGKIQMSQLPMLIGSVYVSYFSLFYKDMDGINFYWITKIGLAFLHFIIIYGVVFIRRKRKLLKILYLVLFPLAVLSINVMAPHSRKYSLMLYSIVSIFLLAIMILDLLIDITRPEIVKNGKRLFVIWTGIFAMLIMEAVYCQYNNVQYLAKHMQYEQGYSYLTTLLTQIKSTEGYNQSTKIVFIGAEFYDLSFDNSKEFEIYTMIGTGTNVINGPRKDFLRRFLGFDGVIEDEDGWKDNQEVKLMPCYPDSGSIRNIGGTIVVKLE